MEIKPTGNKLLLKKIEEEFSAGGLALPQTGGLRSDATVAEVLETGPGYETNEKGKCDPCLIKKGQRVIFNAQAGLKISREITKTTELTLIREDQIYAVLENYEPIRKDKR